MDVLFIKGDAGKTVVRTKPIEFPLALYAQQCQFGLFGTVTGCDEVDLRGNKGGSDLTQSLYKVSVTIWGVMPIMASRMRREN